MNDILLIIDEYEKSTGVRLDFHQILTLSAEINQVEIEEYDGLLVKTLYALPITKDNEMGFLAFEETTKCISDYNDEIISAETIDYKIIANI